MVLYELLADTGDYLYILYLFKFFTFANLRTLSIKSFG